VGRCPNCGQRALFRQGSLFKVNASCPRCGLKIDKGEGAFLGPLVVNYGVTVFGLTLPIILGYAAGKLSGAEALGICGAVALIAPLVLYRLSWSWWLTIYYLFLPENLPGNLEGQTQTDE
jgi:uncharacterized protein (DUF983 family)